jgi:hypothetical protein
VLDRCGEAANKKKIDVNLLSIQSTHSIHGVPNNGLPYSSEMWLGLKYCRVAVSSPPRSRCTDPSSIPSPDLAGDEGACGVSKPSAVLSNDAECALDCASNCSRCKQESVILR